MVSGLKYPEPTKERNLSNSFLRGDTGASDSDEFEFEPLIGTEESEINPDDDDGFDELSSSSPPESRFIFARISARTFDRLLKIHQNE